MEPLNAEGNYALRVATCVPGLIVWTIAGGMCVRWLTLLGGDKMTFPRATSASLLPALWMAIVFGVPVAAVVAHFCARGKISLIWQPLVVCFGLVAIAASIGD